MNNLGNRLDLSIPDLELFAQCFEGAVIAPMSKTATMEHVKRNGFGMSLWIVMKSKLGVFIDEVCDQPCGRHAIDARAWPRNPCPIQIFLPGTLLTPLRFGNWDLCLFCTG